jgi:hypothetical protein
MLFWIQLFLLMGLLKVPKWKQTGASWITLWILKDFSQA